MLNMKTLTLKQLWPHSPLYLVVLLNTVLVEMLLIMNYNNWASLKVYTSHTHTHTHTHTHSHTHTHTHMPLISYTIYTENAGSLCKVYGDNLHKLITVLSERSLRGELPPPCIEQSLEDSLFMTFYTFIDMCNSSLCVWPLSLSLSHFIFPLSLPHSHFSVGVYKCPESYWYLSINRTLFVPI